MNRVFPKLDINYLDFSLINKAKRMAVSRNEQHIWKDMSEEELLRSTNLILIDSETSQGGGYFSSYFVVWKR